MSNEVKLFEVIHDPDKDSIRIVIGEDYQELEPKIKNGLTTVLFNLLSRVLEFNKFLFLIVESNDQKLSVISTEQYNLLSPADQNFVIESTNTIISNLKNNRMDLTVH